MAHGLASGWIETDGDRVEFSDCPAYSEKNWGGAGFPLKWWWTQCNSFPDYPDLSITATGGNRGVVMLPNVREDVGAVGVHFGDRFFQFVPAQQVEGESPDGYGAEAVLEASAVTWDVEWGKWSVTAVGERYECSIEGACTDTDESTVIRAPTDSLDDGMAPLCRGRSRDPSSSHSGVSTLAASVARPSSTPPRATPRVSRSAAVLGSPPTAPRPRFARRSALSWVSRWTSPPSPTSSRLSAISSRVSDARSRHRLTTPFTPSRASHRVSPPQTVKHPTDEKRKKCKSTRHNDARASRPRPRPSPRVAPPRPASSSRSPRLVR